jgi:uncharacterized membrane protein
MSGDSRSVRRRARDAVLAGLTVVVPVLATVLVVGFTVQFLSALLDPLVAVVSPVVPTAPLVVRLLAVAVLAAVVVVVGLAVDTLPGGDARRRQVDSVLASIPVVGTMYASFLDVSETFLRADAEDFQSVKLVEMDVPDRYAIAFRTSETPQSVTEACDCPEMMTLFVPSAPNPLVGGDVVYVTTDRVYDVDMTVEEGLRAVLTSGTADDSRRIVEAEE